MKKFALSAAALFVSLSLTGCAFQNLGTFDETPSSPTEESAIPEPKTVGDTFYGDDYAITLNGARFSSTGVLGSGPSRDKFLVIDVTIENNASEELSVSTLLMMDLVGSDSKRYEIDIFAETDTPIGGSVMPQGKIRGEVAFDVKDLDSYTFSYKNGLLADSVQFEIPAKSIK